MGKGRGCGLLWIQCTGDIWYLKMTTMRDSHKLLSLLLPYPCARQLDGDR